MKKIKIYIGCMALLASVFTACKKDYLEVPATNFVSDETMWASASNADLFLNDIYNQLPNINAETEHLDQYTDNSDVGVLWMSGYSRIATAQITPTNIPVGPWDMWKWESNFKNIRKCNLFITKVSASALPNDYKTQRVAEARFLRVLYYHWLWAAYGGLPIITVPLDNLTQGDDIYKPRASEKETFKFITSELDTIAKVLPLKVDPKDYGRPTKGAALTLKGWCELYEASPLRNPAGDVSLWKQAAATNKAVIALGVYDLYPDYINLFLEKGNNSSESIFARQYGPQKGSPIEGKQGPVRNANGAQVAWGNFQPTQELVDAFAMANGKAITDANSGYDPSHPYLNREDRFYKTIIYDSAIWKGYAVTTRVGGNNAIDLGYSSDNTHTGYYARKRLDESRNPSDNFTGIAYQNYMFFRYAEVLLSFAEAENEASGPTAEVLSTINKIRARGNTPSIEATYGSVSKDQLREIIRRERRVELCFEDKRWWDVIRWKIAEKQPDGTPGVLNRPEIGMLITTEANNTLKYTPTIIRNRLFLPKMYLMPVPQAVIDQNPAIGKQSGTDGWLNGQNPGY